MADGVVAVLPSTSSSALDIDNSAFGSTTMRQRVVIGGDTSSGALLNPATTAPSSDVYGLNVRLAMNSTANTIGSVYLAGGATGYTVGSVYPGSTFPVSITAAGSSINFGMVAAGSSSYLVGQVWQGSTFAVSLPTATVAGSTALPAGSTGTLIGAVAVSSGVVLGPGSTANSIGSVAIVGGATGNLLGYALLSTGLAGAAIDPRYLPAFETRVDSFTSAANGTAVVLTAKPLSQYGIQVVGASSTPTSWDVRLEGSLDGTYYSTILTHTQVTGDRAILWSGATLSPSLYFRSRCAGLVLGVASTQINVTILGVS